MIETFKLSTRELEARFTKSELVITAWRSQEIAYQMNKDRESTGEGKGKKQKRQYPDKFYNEQGELDLSKVTGKEALKFFSAQGIKFPVMKPKKKK